MLCGRQLIPVNPQSYTQENTNMLGASASYDFKPGKIYNLESSQFICNEDLGGMGTGQSDIAKPEVAHAVWSAAYPS
jgi:hypothetical protein